MKYFLSILIACLIISCSNNKIESGATFKDLLKRIQEIENSILAIDCSYDWHILKGKCLIDWQENNKLLKGFVYFECYKKRVLKQTKFYIDERLSCFCLSYDKHFNNPTSPGYIEKIVCNEMIKDFRGYYERNE